MIYYTLINCESHMVLKGKLTVNDSRSVNGFRVDSVPYLLENVNIITLLLLPFSIVMHY
jgi:hypothetical protein